MKASNGRNVKNDDAGRMTDAHERHKNFLNEAEVEKLLEENSEHHALQSRRFAGAVALAGCIFTIVTFYPGFLSHDSLDQFEQSLNFHFNDWHPPTMAFVWSILNALWVGPQPMLVLQAVLYWGGVFYVTSTIRVGRPLIRWILTFLLFSPVILNFAGVIWKDVQLAAAWSFVIGFVFAFRSSGMALSTCKKATLLAIVLYGGLVRYNAGLVAAPLVLYVLAGRPLMRRLSSTVVIYLCVGLLILTFSRGVNYLLHAETTPVLDGLLSFDIAGISIRTKKNLYPFTLSAAEMDSVAACYGDASAHEELIWGPCEFVWSNIKLVRQTDKSAMLHAWFAATVGHPVAYIRHRLKHFAALLAVTRSSPLIWWDGIHDNHFGLETRRHGLFHVLAGYVQLLSFTFLFRPITWLTTSVLLIVIAASKKFQLDDEKASFVMTSGLLAAGYMLTYLPVGVSSDFRYAYLSIVTTTFALCVLVGELCGSSTKALP